MTNWKALLEEAFKIIDDVNQDGNILPSEMWTLGGGTALMLQINHRDSHDIDIFLTDPQRLQLITSSVAEYQSYRKSVNYSGDGSKHLRVEYSGVGEIDFIVSPYLTDDFANRKLVNDRSVQVETITEIIAKKVFNRGYAFQPRDIFDLASACAAGFRESIVMTISEFPDQVMGVLNRIENTSAETVVKNLSSYNIHPNFNQVVPKSLDIAKDAMQESLNLSNSAGFTP